MKILLVTVFIAILAFATISYAADAAVRKANAADAEALQKKFDTFTENTPCTPNQTACIKGAFAKCTVVQENGKFVNKFSIQPCNGANLQCFVLPLVNSRGTSLVCTTKADRDARIEQAKKNL
ncbi:hypothetical protein RclHR1_13460002 [Rhizophagus clarus]|nr:hypothetical protein RclHR1_13460002 [Rhizophagus clarus]